MTEHGFMNTRILEAMACGVPVLSDYVDIIEKLFGDSVLFYTNEEQFVEQAEKIQVDYLAIRERVEQMWQMLQEEYSFESHKAAADIKKKCREKIKGYLICFIRSLSNYKAKRIHWIMRHGMINIQQ